MLTHIELFDTITRDPPIVHISDIHGYLADARSALLAVGEIEPYAPIVVTDDAERLYWADNDYVLVTNGGVIDRGPSNDDCLALVWRLIEEASAG